MGPKPIRVGVVGASPERGWAAQAHVPALAALPQYTLTAVATSRAETAHAAARVFGAAHAFTDARRLAEHPEVDLVVVTVKVAAHAELVRAALGAGKPVLCEWPLGGSTEESAHLAEEARAAGVHHMIGLQARYAPAIAYARDLVAEGRIGRVTSAAVHAARGKGAGGRVPGWAAYTLDRAGAAGAVEVMGGHTLDALQHVVGDLGELSATLSVQYPVVTVAETGRAVEATSPDHLAVHGTLTGGAVFSALMHDAKRTDARTRIEISGTEGDLAVVSTQGGGAAGVQIDALRVLGTDASGSGWRESPIPARYRWAAGSGTGPGLDPAAKSFNVAQAYARLADDLRTGARTVPDFHDALRLHRLLDTIRESAATGTRRKAG